MKSLKYLNKLSRKAVFNKVKDHLLKQKRKSINKAGACLYRGPNGFKCAAGCLIPDEIYDNLLEHKRANAVFSGIKHCELIQALQEVHDFSNPRSWKKGLDKVATEFKIRS